MRGVYKTLYIFILAGFIAWMLIAFRAGSWSQRYEWGMIAPFHWQAVAGSHIEEMNFLDSKGTPCGVLYNRGSYWKAYGFGFDFEGDREMAKEYIRHHCEDF